MEKRMPELKSCSALIEMTGGMEAILKNNGRGCEKGAKKSV
jgi:hypothetical protein